MLDQPFALRNAGCHTNLQFPLVGFFEKPVPRRKDEVPMNPITRVLLTAIAVSAIAASASAAFIVEPGTGGLAQANYSYTGDGTAASVSGTPTAALGTIATDSIYGGNGATFDQYTSTYTPGTDADNFTPAAGTDLGNGDLATGVTGGDSALYNVYFTAPSSTNVNLAGSNFTIQNDGA